MNENSHLIIAYQLSGESVMQVRRVGPPLMSLKACGMGN
jgi:hypothetical protein